MTSFVFCLFKIWQTVILCIAVCVLQLHACCNALYSQSEPVEYTALNFCDRPELVLCYD